MDKYGIGLNGSYYVLDLINNFSINETSTVSEFPLITKELIVDHKFNEPRTITISGTISNINKSLVPYFQNVEIESFENKENEVKSEGIKYKSILTENYLSSVYNFLRDLKTQNVILDIYTPNIIIKNCILVDIQWNDFNSYSEISLNFKEIKTLLFREVVEQIKKPDPNLPDLNDAIPQSAIETLLLQDTRETDLLIYKAMEEKELITNEVLQGFAMTAGTVVSLAAGALIVAGVVALALLISNPGGWVVLAVLAVLAAYAYLIYSLVKWWKRWVRRRYYIREFQHYRDDKANKKELKRYTDMLSKIHGELKQLNKVILAYSINTNDNQDILINMNDEFYTIQFKRDKEAGSYRFRIKNQEDQVVQEWKELKPFKSFYSCSEDNYEFIRDGVKIYFVYNFKKSNVDENNDKYVIKNQELKDVNIVITGYNMDKFKESIGKIAIEALKIENN